VLVVLTTTRSARMPYWRPPYGVRFAAAHGGAFAVERGDNSSASFWAVGRPFFSRIAISTQRIASDCCECD